MSNTYQIYLISDSTGEMLERISPNIRLKEVVPKYLNYNIKTTKIRHVHTFGKYEVFSPENTLGFHRMVFMVRIKIFTRSSSI